MAGINHLNNLVAIMDVNRLGQSEPTARAMTWMPIADGFEVQLAHGGH